MKHTFLSERKLEVALSKAKKDFKEGKFVKESVEKHIKRITRWLK